MKSENCKSKPRVFIALASDILGGPGKGLAQFLRHGGLEGCHPLIAAYYTRNDEPNTEFIRAMRATGAEVAVLRQRRSIDLGLLPQALGIIGRHGSEILQSHGYKSHVLCWLARRRTGLPWVAFVHGWTDENIKMRFYNALERAILPLADTVVAVSGDLAQKIPKEAARKCRVITNAVAQEEMGDENRTIATLRNAKSEVFSPSAAKPGEAVAEGARANSAGFAMRSLLGIPQNAVVAGVVGRLSPEKGQMVFLRALALGLPKDCRLFGLLVGGGPMLQSLKDEADKLGLARRCVFTGQVSCGPAAYYRAMDMVIMPSFSEGMPNVALEAMLMGLPVIASRVGGLPEVVVDEKTGFLLPPGDAEAFCQAMLGLAFDPGLRAWLGKRGRDRMLEGFSSEERAKRILSVYADLSSFSALANRRGKRI